MATSTYYYARASSVLPPVYQQVEAFQEDGADNNNIIIEKASSKESEWPEYQIMKNHMLHSGDTLVISTLASRRHIRYNTDKDTFCPKEK